MSADLDISNLSPEERILISIDVAAYQHFAVHFADVPVTLAELREYLSNRDWYPTVREHRWPALYAAYMESFEKYKHDPEAVGYRAKREARERGRERRPR